MASINLRDGLNAISDVVNNRPRALREFDQIFMKSADMLLQVDHISRIFDGKDVVFIGDGDAIGLSLVHLRKKGLIEQGPNRVHILDFDERIIRSLEDFARVYELEDRITAQLYNVAEPLPVECRLQFDAFYTNPPFGSCNGGKSVEAFLMRGAEAIRRKGFGCIVIADHDDYPWAEDVLHATQKYLIENGFMVKELIPKFHKYHLDDAPELTSCSLVVKKVASDEVNLSSLPLPDEFLRNFYGHENPLKVQYVRDKTNGGKLISGDYEFQQIGGKTL